MQATDLEIGKEDAKNFLAKYPCILYTAQTLFLLPAYLSETLFTSSCKTLFFMRLTPDSSQICAPATILDFTLSRT